ncbi:Zinc finger, GRF-type [Sesbania bispinosa]|nr:Zinc finger, GRF-type [Sesbania bispinosa]
MGGESEHPQSRTHRRNNNGSWSTSSPSMGNVGRLCHCGLKAAERISKTQRNPGRAFYSCPLPKVRVLDWDMGSPPKTVLTSVGLMKQKTKAILEITLKFG